MAGRHLRTAYEALVAELGLTAITGHQRAQICNLMSLQIAVEDKQARQAAGEDYDTTALSTVLNTHIRLLGQLREEVAQARKRADRSSTLEEYTASDAAPQTAPVPTGEDRAPPRQKRLRLFARPEPVTEPESIRGSLQWKAEQSRKRLSALQKKRQDPNLSPEQKKALQKALPLQREALQKRREAV